MAATDLKTAIAAARASDWDAAHSYTQANQGETLADWLHAILHKIEPDEANARYWYGRCGRAYEDFDDTGAELDALEKAADRIAIDGP